MLSVHKILPAGRGLAPVLVKRAARVELDWDVRQKSRFDATDSQGRTLGVFLPRGTCARGGDVLVAEDGSLITVLATSISPPRTTLPRGRNTPRWRPALSVASKRLFWRVSQSSSTVEARFNNTGARPRPCDRHLLTCSMTAVAPSGESG